MNKEKISKFINHDKIIKPLLFFYCQVASLPLRTMYFKRLISFLCSQNYDYSNRRRLSTPSPSPTRDIRNGKTSNTNGSWFKSLDRLSRKKSKKVCRNLLFCYQHYIKKINRKFFRMKNI